METKTIPFDLETAKKIQAGEIQGRITTKEGKDVRIICTDKASTDDDNRTQIVCLIRLGARELVSIHDPNTGQCWDIEDGKAQHLVLEVPDIKPQFKVGDKVRVRPNDTHSHFVKQYDNCIGKIVGTNHEYFVVIVTGAFQDQFKAEELQLIEETTGQDVTFQEGNKPQGKRILAECKWGDDGEPYYDVLHWHPTSGLKYPEGWYDQGGENVPDSVIKRFAEF